MTDPCDGTADVIIDPVGAIATDAGIQTLNANPAGGDWSGASTDGTFDPAIGVGTYDVTYTVDFGNGCIKTDTISIEVVPPGDPCAGIDLPTIDPVGPLFTTDATVNLIGNPAGGTWGGASTDGTFDPSIGVGTYNVTYTVDNGAGCVQTANIDIIVTDPCDIDLMLDQVGPFTTDDPIQLLTATPIGGMWSGEANKIGNFDPSRGPGTYTVTYTYMDLETGCSAEGSMDILVEAGLEPLEDINGFIIYPVPTAGDLNINLENYMNELVQVRIVDASSRVVFEKVFDANHLLVETIDLNYLSSGIYHLLFDSMGYRSDVTFTVNK